MNEENNAEDVIYGQLEDAFNDIKCAGIELEMKNGELVDIIPKSLTTSLVSGIDTYGFRVTIPFNEIDKIVPLYEQVEVLHEGVM